MHRAIVSMRPVATLVAIAAVALVGCPGDTTDDVASLTVTAEPASIVADGVNTVTVTVTGVDASGEPLTGLILVTTDRGTFDGGGQSFTGQMAGGALPTLTLTSCDSFTEPTCAGTARVRATFGRAQANASITFEPFLREVNCEDGTDDDGDNLIDCADTDDCIEGTALSNGAVCRAGARACEPDGRPAAAEATETTCSDGLDNDCDGTPDCGDTDCDTRACSANDEVCDTGICVCSHAPNDAEGVVLGDCFDGIDNDCDGDIDEADADCLGMACDTSGNRWNDPDGAAGPLPVVCECVAEQDPEQLCGDGFDNDCDGVADCADSDCNNAACSDELGFPDNNVGRRCSFALAACACPGDPLGTGNETVCDDGLDNDCDGLFDCEDGVNCGNSPCGQNGRLCTDTAPLECVCPGGDVETACGDNLDNDCDGARDCEDSDCAGVICGANGLTCLSNVCACPGAEVNESSCNDNQDNDCDGLRDCADPNCDTLVCASCGGPADCICDFSSTSCVPDPGFYRLTFTADKPRALADGVDEITLTAYVENNSGPTAAWNVDFVVPVGGIVEASGGTTHSMNTDANGFAVIHWRPGLNPAKQLAPSATIVSDPGPPTSNTKTVLIDVIGLQNISVDNIQYTTMGARASGWRETSDISFRLVGTNGIDQNLAMPDGVVVDFALSTIAGGLALDRVSDSTVNGIASTTAIAGSQAVPFSVEATVTVGLTTDTVTTDSINIVGAKPSHLGFQFSCSQKNVNGLGKFGENSSMNNADPPGISVSCQVNVNDRWLNPISRPGIALQFTTEGGTITTGMLVSNGISTTTFRTGGAVAHDVAPLAGEPSWVHTFGTDTKTRNPRDGFYTLLAYVPGEEQFADTNGNGDYDLGENWVDLGEPYVDRDDSGAWEAGEFFFDSNNNGSYDGPNGVWDNDTTIWDETRMVVSGCQGDQGAPGYGFLNAFGDIPDGGGSSAILRTGDINLNTLAGGSRITLSKVGPISKVEFPDQATSRIVPDVWGIGWAQNTDCSSTPCVVTSQIVPPTTAVYGYMVQINATDGTANNPTCTVDADCTQGGTCPAGRCINPQGFTATATVGPPPCSPGLPYATGGTVD